MSVDEVGIAKSGHVMSHEEGPFSRFLRNQLEPAMELAAASDILDLHSLDPQHYIAHFHCATVVRSDGTPPAIRQLPTTVGIFLPSDYLVREPNSGVVLTCLAPLNHFHPNIRGPLICIGHIKRGDVLTDLLYRTYEVISYQNYATLEWDCLELKACSWARTNQERLPVDPRPLKRRPGGSPTDASGTEVNPA